jgi:D-2-hydroxyglutarate dehydrogenase
MGDTPLVGDGTISTSQKGNEDLWRLRETISESLKKAGVVYKYDVSLPLDNFYELVEVMR